MKNTNRYFYSHLVDVDSLLPDLASLTLSDSEKKELLELAHIHVHQTVMDAILSQLNGTNKKRFMELVAMGDDEKIWSHLNKKVEKIEEKITNAADSVKAELKEDIKKVKR